MDEAVGEGRFFGEQTIIRLKVHISPERYHESKGSEIVPLQAKSGTRVYIHSKPYILEPDYTLTVGVYQSPTAQGAIGEVAGSYWAGMCQRDVGQAQAWLYPEDRTLVLWECFLEHWYRGEDPRTDETLRATWLGFEGFLLRQFSETKRIVTPSWEPIYVDDRDAWPDFLKIAGYERIGKRAFGKEIRHENTS